MEPLVLEPVLRYVRVQLKALHRVAPMEPLVLEPLLKAAESAQKKACEKCASLSELKALLPDGRQCIAAKKQQPSLLVHSLGAPCSVQIYLHP